MLKLKLAIRGLVVALLGTGAWAAEATAQSLTIELNRLQQVGEGCRFDLVVENALDVSFASFSVDLVLFDRSGVISSRAATHFGRLRANKTHLRSFVLSPFACGGVSRVLLNEVTACEHSGPAGADCMDWVAVRHLGAVPLVK